MVSSASDSTTPYVRPSLIMPDTADIVGILLRGWLIIAALTATGFLIGVTIVELTPTSYKANVRMMFERSVSTYLKSNKLVEGPTLDDYDAWSQIYVIASEATVLPVIRSMNLASDQEIVAPPQNPLRAAVRFVTGIFKSAAASQAESSKAPEVERLAVDGVLTRLNAFIEGSPPVINVSFESSDPQKAADIANAVVESYLAANAARRLDVMRIAGRLMQDRLEELKRQAAEAERAVLEFKSANNLIDVTKKGTSSDQLSSLSTSLAAARIAMAEARARIERLEQSDPETRDMFTPDNELIGKLRTQYMDIKSRILDIESRVGKGHEAAAKLNLRLEEVNAAIAAEKKKIADTYKRDYELAKARYEELASTTAEVMGEERSTSDVQARARELESAADTLRSAYNAMLQRYGENARVEGQAPAVPDIRILTRASPPQLTESRKRLVLLLAGGSVAGLLLGITLVIGRDFPIGVFRTVDQVKNATGLFCAVIPRIEGKDQRLEEYVLRHPYSRFAEALRNVWALTSVNLAGTDNKIVCVVSAVPEEGKSTIASNLASLVALQTGLRTLLVDADLVKHAITNRLAPDPTEGLVEALDDPERLARLVVRREVSGLDVLPCPTSTTRVNTSGLFGAQKLESLLRAMRQRYDLVIVESPPTAAVADFRMLARFCDQFITVVEWGKTSQKVVFETFEDYPDLANRSICMVLNKAEPQALRAIEWYKGRKVQDYYLDS